MGSEDSPEGNGKAHRGCFQVGAAVLALKLGQMLYFRVMFMYGKLFLFCVIIVLL